ncbi:MAG: AraC family transcriptional regulator [Cyclobacteriaceae bacterium]|nr:AraC family transcriptional regulator [Cyclobacteriaceae bacterium HetDA_MAG_MS6]
MFIENVILSIGIFNGLMLAIILMRQHKSNPFLGLFLLVYSLILAKFLGYCQGYLGEESAFIAFGEQLDWLLGPFIFFFAKQYFGKRVRHKTLHFIPFILHTAILTFIHVQNILGEPVVISIHQLSMPVVKTLQELIYIFLSLKITRKSKLINLLLLLFTGQIFATLLLHVTTNLIVGSQILDIVIFSVMMLSVNSIAFIGLRKSTLFSKKIKIDKHESEGSSGNHKEIFEELDQLIQGEKLFLNHSLKLSDISEKLRQNEKVISRAINEIANENFNAFINRYRIDYAIRLLLSDTHKNFTIDAIAEDSGFYNKVSFYKAFKRITGSSPTEYRRKQSKGLKQVNL